MLLGNAQAQFDPEKFEENLKNATFKQKFETANSLMEDRMYEFAVKVWVHLAEEDPLNANVNYKAGYCYLNISLERNKALPYLLKAEEKISKRYDPFSFAEKNAPIETNYYLGKALHLDKKFDEAIENYTLFQETAGKKHRLYDEASLGIIYANNAKTEVASEKNFEINNIGAPINGVFSDFSPVVTADESALFFTSRRLRTDTAQPLNKGVLSPQDGKYFEDVYVSYKDMKTGKWGEPELLEFCSPRSNQATISVSPDGQFLFIYKDDNGDGNIYISERDDLTYKRPVKMGLNSDTDINTKYWETHATLSADGKTLYFVSDRPGGLGGRDIYRVVKLPNGKWSKALNLGAPINTPYDEDSPFLHTDGRTLYFSSNGEKSMGGFDIFFSQLDENGNWKEPLNIGYPLNSVDDDIFFTTTVDGKRGYYSSAHAGGLGETDIYTIKLDTVVQEQIAILKGYIDPGTEPELPKGIVIWVSDLTEGGDPLQYRPNRRTGSYVFNLKPCHEYLVEYTRDDKTFYETEFKVPCEADYHVIDKVISLGGIPLTTTPDPSLEEFKDQWTYQIFIDDQPYRLGGKAQIMDKENPEWTELITREGKFKYRELKSKKDPVFELQVNDPTLCDKFSIKLLDEKGEVIKVTTRNIRCKIISTEVQPVSFQKFYGYNEKGVGSERERFNEFVRGVEAIIEARGYARVEVEGSASNVPTATHGSNKKLATKRSNEAKDLMMSVLKKKGVDLSKVKLVAVNSIVQGPVYNGDFKDTKKYAKYQYIMMKAY